MTYQCNGPAALIWREFLVELQTLPRFGEFFFFFLQAWRIQQPYLNSSFCATALHNHMECTWDFDIGLCHFNFSWALFSFHCVFSLFTSFELYGGKFVEYRLFVYFLHFNLCIPFYWYLYCFKKSIQSSIVFMEFLWEYLWYIHQVTG